MTRLPVARLALAFAALAGIASLSACGGTSAPVEAELAAGDYAKGPTTGDC